MKSVRELDNIHLLYDVKRDALKPTDELVDDSGIGCLVDFAKTIKEKNIDIYERRHIVQGYLHQIREEY